MDFAKQKTEGESGINGYRSLYSEHYPSFAGEGVKRVLNAYTALSLTAYGGAPSRKEPWFGQLFHSVRDRGVLRVLVVFYREHMECSPTDDLIILWVPVGFAGIGCFMTGANQITPNKRTIAVRLLSAGISNKLQIRNNVTKCPGMLPYG